MGAVARKVPLRDGPLRPRRACSTRSGRARSSPTSACRTTRPARRTPAPSSTRGSTASRSTCSRCSTRPTPSTSTTRTTRTGSRSTSKQGRRAVVLRTFSKIYGLAGLRVGYAVGPAELVTAIGKTRRAFDLTTPAQAAALASLDAPGELARRRDENAARRPELERILRSHGLEPVGPAVGNFVYVDLDEDARPLFERLLREGVIVRPLHGFGAPDAIRVSVGTADEHAFLDAALGRVVSARPPRPRPGRTRPKAALVAGRSRCYGFAEGGFLASKPGGAAASLARVPEPLRRHARLRGGHLVRVRRAPGRHPAPDGLGHLGRSPPDRRVPARRRDRARARAAARPARAARADDRRRPAALAVFCALPFARRALADRRARLRRGDRHRLLPARRLRRAAEPRRRGGSAAGELAAAGGREPELGGRAARSAGSSSRLRAGPRVLGQRRDLRASRPRSSPRSRRGGCRRSGSPARGTCATCGRGSR